MRKPKKFITFLLSLTVCLTMAFAVAGCGSVSDESGSGGNPPESSSTETKRYTIVFKDADGGELFSTEVEEGKTPEFGGTMPALPEATAQYTYSWAWDKEIVAAAADAVYTLRLITETNKYEIKFLAADGTELKVETLEYGTTPVAPSELPPVKEATAQYEYDWKWDKEIAEVTGTAVYTLEEVQTVRKYTVKFVDAEGKELQNETLEYGSSVTVPAFPAVPEATAQFTYSWKWDSEVADTVTEDVTYTLERVETVNTYTVSFVSEGVTIQAQTLAYGAAIVEPQAPEKNGYAFMGWEPAVAETVTGEATYAATFAKKLTQADAGNFKTIIAENSDEYFVLASDLDFGGANLAGAEIFTGTLDGRGYALKNFTAKWYETADGVWNAAVFKENKGTIRNLSVQYSVEQVNGTTGFVESNSGKIENCYFDITLKAYSWTTGTIAGTNSGTIENCIVNLHEEGLTDLTRIGGLVGTDCNGTLRNCYVIHNGVLKGATDRMYVETWGNGVKENCASYETMKELAAAVKFEAANGWNNYWSVKNDSIFFEPND